MDQDPFPAFSNRLHEVSEVLPSLLDIMPAIEMKIAGEKRLTRMFSYLKAPMRTWNRERDRLHMMMNVGEYHTAARYAQTLTLFGPTKPYRQNRAEDWLTCLYEMDDVVECFLNAARATSRLSPACLLYQQAREYYAFWDFAADLLSSEDNSTPGL